MNANLKEVLTLEIRDEAVRAIFNSLRAHFQGGKIPRTPHLTIRGPYSRHISRDVFARVARTLEQGTELMVAGVGRFDSPSEHVVFLKVAGESLRKVWWKPDYPLKHHGFNPHITVFRGQKEDADRVYEFLRNQKTEFSVTNFEIRTDTIGQGQRELEFI